MKNGTKIYTVSQVNSLIKGILGSNLPGQMTVSGEISGWKGAHSSGIYYFSLKDEGAVLPCVMWPDKFRKVKFRPENGLAIFGTGYISVYELQGKYQFYIESMEPAGKGVLWLAYEQTKNRLAEEGLFDKAHKKPLPKYPRRIGILTSESGAAVRDIEKSIFDRWSCVLCLYPVPVQGEGAAEKIAAAIRDVNRRNRALRLDTLIVGRGGGSMEDLWAFNEEILARAIFGSKIPVISAVGHEIDTTIADLVADMRASTPTRAGAVAVPDKKEVLEVLTDMERRLAREIDSRLELSAERLQTLLASSVFRNPLLPVRNREQQLDEMGGTLEELIRDMLASAREKLREYYEQVVKIEPHRLLGKHTVDLNNLINRLAVAAKAVTNKAQVQLTAQGSRLAALNPKSVLNRGYSITTSKRTGRLIKRPVDIEIGYTMVTELANENLIESKVTKKQNKGS
jgi:exodeoxyribonuclease VII large subunit